MKTKNKTVFLYQKPSQKAPKTLRSSISKETKKKRDKFKICYHRKNDEPYLREEFRTVQDFSTVTI